MWFSIDMNYISKVMGIIIIVAYSSVWFSQDNQDPFKKLYDQNGLLVQFLFYSEGDGVHNNGVVIFLTNKNEFDIAYSFTLVFRATSIDETETVSGYLKAGERKVGSNEGLYFIPFKDDKSITEVGISKCEVEKQVKGQTIIK
jgi:hypothetical protein